MMRKLKGVLIWTIRDLANTVFCAGDMNTYYWQLVQEPKKQRTRVFVSPQFDLTSFYLI